MRKMLTKFRHVAQAFRSLADLAMRVTLKDFIFQGTQRTGAGTAEHLRAIRGLSLSPEQQLEHEHLYNCLTILDGKAAALLQFDSILVGVSAIALTLPKGTGGPGTVAIIVALICASLSSALTLIVICLFWTETTDFQSSTSYFSHLLHVRDRRSVFYRLAWIAALVSLLALAVGAILYRTV